MREMGEERGFKGDLWGSEGRVCDIPLGIGN